MTTPTSVKSPGRPMDVHREIALLDAALDLLAEVGYERLTLTAVCERATASTKTMHHRWGNKDELLTAAPHRAAYWVINQSADVTATGSLRGDLPHNLAPNGGAQAQHPAKHLSGLLVADGQVDAAFVESLVDRVLLPVLTSRQSGDAQ
ncbi:helix-turn-helix domain-containing protein [Streptomyces ipomoeae]|uniref:helix-turn-helix domain-containing protein n=1 Tax=Streptomyces ipomoeae TaxID=103232 RepID=UPI0011474E7F|nr:helix-turn-helix domain-containing protein [Streptomyces ipomoeae]MDX2935546.1 helix-turn-helix domain containing protein [Streptomyces ipomoeae]TQE18370.1 TetR/AcrR family transcriptional regulator [Streptomyces ipomoeae]